MPPKNSARGLSAFYAVDIIQESTGQKSRIDTNSTALLLSKGVALNGQNTVGLITANSTALLIPATGIQMAALTTLKITSNSTGIKIGTKYISCNSTGNATT
jgi:hypothetical protein